MQRKTSWFLSRSLPPPSLSVRVAIRALCSNFYKLSLDWLKFSEYCTLIGYITELPLATKIDSTGAVTDMATMVATMATGTCGVISFAFLFIFPTNALDNGLAITPPSKQLLRLALFCLFDQLMIYQYHTEGYLFAARVK